MSQVTSGSVRVNATYTTSGNVGDYIIFSWSRTGYSSSLNCSYINWSMVLYSGGAGYISSSASKSWRVNVNGSSYSGTNSVGIGNNTSKTLASGNTTIYHNNDGTKSFSVSFSQTFDITFNKWVGTISGSGSWELVTIPRYANFTSNPELTDITQTSAKLSWSADANCHYVNYYLNGQVVNDNHKINSSSGTFTFTGLTPGTNYIFSVRIWRTDSDLYTTSPNISESTLPLASLNITDSISLDIGNDLTLSILDSDQNASTLKLSVENDAGDWITVDSAQTTIPINTVSFTWNLSTFADTLYKYCTTKNNMNFRISCGTTLNDKYYENVYNGIMHVINANPLFINFTASNTAAEITSVLGNSLSTVQNMGNFRVQIPVASKAVPQKGAAMLKYVAYLTQKNSSTIIKSSSADFSESSLLNIDLGTYPTAGTFQLHVYAVDSRNNTSTVISKECYILPYHAPATTMNIHRVNNFEKEILLELYIQYSRLLTNSVAKNSVDSIQYRYAEVGTDLPPAWTSITGYSSEIVSENTNDAKITYLKNSISNCFISNLPVEKSYNIEFKITDKIGSVVIPVTIEQGVPIIGEFDNGHVSIGMIPDFNNPSKLQVYSDISVYDTGDRKQKNILEEMKRIVLSSPTEPTNQCNGYIWLKETSL